MIDLINEKNLLRKIQKKKREVIHLSKKGNFDQSLLKLIYNELNFDKINIISSFFSINSEIQTDSLNNYLWEQNKLLCFPVIENEGKPLVFRKYNKNEDKKIGNFNIFEPNKKNQELYPEIIFVPLLAFDNKGYRLGYGGGYYDKTLANFKKLNHNFKSIGFCYDDQLVSRIPIDEFDYKLDYVLTEKQLYRFK